MWFLCFLLVASCSAFPWGDLRDRPGQFDIQLVQFPSPSQHRFCFPSPFLGQICIPSTLQFFLPLQSVNIQRQRCLLLPLIKAYKIKVCPQNGGSFSDENDNKTLKEIMVGEKEKELLSSDNTNIEVERENFVKKENDVENKEPQVEDKDAESKNKIILTSKENFGVEEAKNIFQEPLPESSEINFDDENVSVTSNLV